MVAISPDGDTRRKIIQKLIMKCGFAITPGDAMKLIKPTAYDCNPVDAFFVVADMHDFRTSTVMNQQLYEMAAKGMAVIVGVKKLPAQFEFICETFYHTYL